MDDEPIFDDEADWPKNPPGLESDDPEDERKEKQTGSPRSQRLRDALWEHSKRDPGLLPALTRSLGEPAATPLLSRTPTGPPIRTTPAPRVWREPARLSRQKDVLAILSYKGSTKFWMPVRDAIELYVTLEGHQTVQRKATLDRIASAITAWRGNQRKNLYLSERDEMKASALRAFQGLMAEEYADLDEPAAIAVVQLPTPTAALSTESPDSLPKQGSRSFEAGLDHTPAQDKLGLIRTVMPREVRELTDQNQCLARIASDGTLWTHDGRFAIDSGGAAIRYVLGAADPDPVLYISQDISESDQSRLSGAEHMRYPMLDSHAQITVASVIGAGDVKVAAGRILSISNQSGTWQPRGSNLAHTLKFMVRIGLIHEAAIVSGAVTVQQFISTAQGYDVDKGILLDLIGAGMQGKLIRRS
jgi:hypothetical protein